MEPRLRACPEQFALLIEYMERHGDLAKPQLGAQGRLRSRAMWSELTTLLNSVGGGVVKPVDKWKKVWADWKTKTKKKYLDIKHHASGTGGGPSSRHYLTAFEERVISVLGVSAVSGQLKLKERGFNIAAPPAAIESAIDVENVILEVPYSPPLHLSDSPPLPPPPPSSPLPLPTYPFPPPPSSPPLPSPPSPSSLLPLSPSLLPLSPSLLPPPPSQGQNRPSPRQRSVTTFRSPTEPRRNRGLTPFERTNKIFAEIEQRRLDLEERRLMVEEEREKRRLMVEEEREKRRLMVEEEREKRRLDFDMDRERRQHERDMKLFELMQSLLASRQPHHPSPPSPPPPPPPPPPN